MDLKGKTILEHVIERFMKSKYIDDVIVATTIEIQDLAILSADKVIRVFCGSAKDVFDRYYQCSKTMIQRAMMAYISH